MSLVVDDLNLHVNVAASCIGVGTRLVFRIRSSLRLLGCNVRQEDLKDNGELELAVVVGANGDASAHGGIGGVCLSFTRNQF